MPTGDEPHDRTTWGHKAACKYTETRSNDKRTIDQEELQVRNYDESGDRVAHTPVTYLRP